MNYLFELSKDHKTFPTSEVYSCLSAENINFSVLESNKDIILIESEQIDIQRATSRLCFSYYVDEFLFKSSFWWSILLIVEYQQYFLCPLIIFNNVNKQLQMLIFFFIKNNAIFFRAFQPI